MNRSVRKYTYIVVLSIVLFFLIIAVLFGWVSKLGDPYLTTLRTYSGIDESSSTTTYSVTSSINPGDTSSHHIKHVQSIANGTMSYIAWTVVDPSGCQVRKTIDFSSPVIYILPLGLTILGSVVETRWTGDHTFSLLLQITFPVSGWISLSTTETDSDMISYYIHPLNTTVVSEEDSKQPGTQSRCGNTSLHQTHMDYHGGDLVSNARAGVTNPIQVKSAIDCCTRCSTVPVCQFWTFLSSGECWLKDHTAKLVPGAADKQLTSGQKVIEITNKPISTTASVQGRMPSASAECCSTAPTEHSQHQSTLLESVSGRLYTTSVTTKTYTPLQSSISTEHIEDVVAMLPPLVHVNSRQQALDTPVRRKLSAQILIKKVRNYKFQAPSLHKKRGNSVYTLIQSERRTSDWWQQQAVGNGRFGALVGGNLRSEVVPLSVAGFFARPHSEAKKQDDAAFRAARADLRALRFAEADKKMSSYIQKDLGMFQYVADIVFVYSPTPIYWYNTPPTAAAAVPPVQSQGKPASHRVPRRSRSAGMLGRAKLLHDLYEHLHYGSSADNRSEAQEGALPPFDDVLLSDGILDMQRGIAHSSILEGIAPSQPQEDSPAAVRAHYREWFVSAVDDVMVGRVSCQSSNQLETDAAPCLNVAMKLHRDHDPTLTPDAKFTAAATDLTPDQRVLWLSPGQDQRASKQAYQFTVTLSASTAAIVPTTVVSGVAICSGTADTAVTFTVQQQTSTEGPVLICNSAQHMHIVLAVESTGKTFTGDSSDEVRTVQQLHHTAEGKVQCALSKGPLQLRAEHAELFATRMSRVDLSLDNALTPAPPLHTCTAERLNHRLESFGDGCSWQQQQVNTVDAALMAQLFQYGRYLLLSSATGAVSNLQGIWTDGPTSAWNGDYHLNINLQMAYWAADTVALPETMKPLRKFLAELAHNGKQVAREMYGCSDPHAWVAHGFLDDRLQGWPYGDNQWALCVTCGAWAALAIWEHLLITPVSVPLLVEVITVLRGIVKFFREYMLREGDADGGYTMHTGPTTSPENSYVILYSGEQQQHIQQQTGAAAADHPVGEGIPEELTAPKPDAGKVPPPTHSVQHLALSPGLDASVLRQVANAFTLAVSWATELSPQWAARDLSLAGLSQQQLKEFADNLAQDAVLAEEFIETIAHMPGGAVPVVDTTLHDAHHSLSLHLNAVSQQRTAAARAKKGQAQTDGNTEKQQQVSYEDAFCSAERGGCVREYPEHLTEPVRIVTQGQQDTIPAFPIFSEDLDVGHRHFSGLHWVYPNTFAASPDPQYQQTLYTAARNTLYAKRTNGGGHTGWSAVWEATLWARLQKPEEAFNALQRFVTTFTAPNLLSLHPPIDPRGSVECGTCFGESMAMLMGRSKQREQNVRENMRRSSDERADMAPLTRAKELRGMQDVANRGRGMVTTDQSKFQIDANLGYLAAMTEMLVHSHDPGVYFLLPALPAAVLAGRGHVYGLRVRGGVQVALSWVEGSLVAAELVFTSAHPWRQGMQPYRGKPGFYRPSSTAAADTVSSVTITALSAFTLATITGSTTGNEDLTPCKVVSKDSNLTPFSQEYSGVLKHCVLRICGKIGPHRECETALQAMAEHRLSSL